MLHNALNIAARAKQAKIIWNETPSVRIANDLTCAVVVFEINQIRHGNTQQRYLWAGLFSTGTLFIEALSSR